MGLDISLIRIVKEPVSEAKWLHAEDSPGLITDFGYLMTERKAHDDTRAGKPESGYYYEEISYQRKGVKKQFYERYSTDEFIFTREQLMELKSYIAQENVSGFESNFVSKFREKETIILMGY